MIKAELKETERSIHVVLGGEANTILNEYMEVTKILFSNLSSVLGEVEAKKIVKKACKKGLVNAVEKEGE